MVEELFMEVVNEAQNSSVNINGPFNIGFNTIMDGKNYMGDKNITTLVIKDKKLFLELLEEYVSIAKYSSIPNYYSDREKIKICIAFLFVNATTEDFLDPISYLHRRINFFNDDTFRHLKEVVRENDDITGTPIIAINKSQSILMETPYVMTFQVTDGTSTYPLPKISYGIVNNTCYIYAVQDVKEKEDGDFYKTIRRKLYKLNKGIEKDEDLIAYEKGETDYYPEYNINDVTMSFVYALDIFIDMLKNKGITTIKVVTYLPLRYLSRDIAATEQNRDDFYERNLRIQKNLTNKLARTFRRFTFVRNDLELASYPYELDEYLTLKVHNKEKSSHK